MKGEGFIKTKKLIHGSGNVSGSIEWYTPECYINSARKVLGGIDCDPATSEKAQSWIKATTYYTQRDNGLLKKWNGRVWLNPPYVGGLVQKFVYKLVDYYEIGLVTSAILLVHNYTDTKWFHRASSYSSAICFTKGRIKFLNNMGVSNSPTHGHVFMYFGNNDTVFASEFSKYGLVLKRVLE